MVVGRPAQYPDQSIPDRHKPRGCSYRFPVVTQKDTWAVSQHQRHGGKRVLGLTSACCEQAAAGSRVARKYARQWYVAKPSRIGATTKKIARLPSISDRLLKGSNNRARRVPPRLPRALQLLFRRRLSDPFLPRRNLICCRHFRNRENVNNNAGAGNREEINVQASFYKENGCPKRPQ